MDTRPIGVFDSGVGGLTVVKQIMKVMPHENIVYFGDTARVPYGTKSKEAVTKYSKQNVRFLLSKEVKAIIVACNTASSNSLDALRETFDVPIFGVVVPGVEEALRSTKNKKIGVIGTPGTVRSGAYERMICEQDSEMQVFPWRRRAGRTTRFPDRRRSGIWRSWWQRGLIPLCWAVRIIPF